MAAGTVAAALAGSWIHRIAGRPVLFVVVAVTMVCNVACALVFNFETLAVLRTCAGLFSGLMMSFSHVGLVQMPKPDREFSIVLGIQVVLGAVARLLHFLPPGYCSVL